MQEAAARSLRRGLERLRPLAKNKTLRYGVPMMEDLASNVDSSVKRSTCIVMVKKANKVFKLLIIGGSFGLREFTQIRYDAQKRHRKMDPALEERIRKNKLSLESEYEKLKSSDFDDWKNVRGPRPWEDSKSLQEQQQQVLHSKPS
ncbi:LOW QUALITY PROTEIN: cytochrome c oxidase assembly protein COX16 homolog, mitochondrial [Emys orbicularis]|uniref:LOW QUALITY PROTEIN: cytochrome c oxidase assembly protein COX16 homolog, mitochondrial n=1 Tax=Emys orbicularis TaxID=82168 RepID=UPI0031FCB74C